MDSATNFKEPPPAMSPPLIRPSARSQVQAPEGTGHDSRPQSRRLEYRSRSVKNRREIDVVIPPLETPHDFRPERVITDDKSAEADPRPTPSTNAGQTTVQEVHKIILSGVSFVHSWIILSNEQLCRSVQWSLSTQKIRKFHRILSQSQSRMLAAA